MNVCISSYLIGSVEIKYYLEGGITVDLAKAYMRACQYLEYSGDPKIMVYIGLTFPKLNII